MADSKITALASISTSTDPAVDPLIIVDVSDTSMAASGTSKKVTLNNLLSSSPTATGAFTVSGLVTAGSTTITGAATVGTTLGVTGNLSAAANSILGTGSKSTDTLLDFSADTGTQRIYLDRGGRNLIFKDVTTNIENYRITGVTGVQTWGVGGSTAMTLNSTGLGIGNAPLSGAKLTVQGADNSVIAQFGGTNRQVRFVTAANGGYDNANFITRHDSSIGGFLWQNNNGLNTLLTIDSSGNVGVGVTPSAWRNTQRALQIGGAGCLFSSTATNGSTCVGRNVYESTAGNYTYIANDEATLYEQGADGKHYWYTAVAGTGTIAFTQAMTLTATGELLVGTNTTSVASGGVVTYGGSVAQFAMGHATGTTSGNAYAGFQYAGTQIGSITQSGTTGVLFNITSDYRLKESVKPLNGGLARVNALKPSVYNWKSDGSTGEGFLAHELAEVVPFAVSGEKDAVNADGSIKSQGIDMSRIVPILVAAIQELTARVQTLEAR